MAKVLNRKQLVFQIKEMLYGADDYIYLICPYINLKSNAYLMNAFEHANKKGVDINVVYSKGFKKEGGQKDLLKYNQVNLCYIADLHMKVYLSEKIAIVSSLNLYDASIKKNLECGILIDRDEDLWKQVYSMIKKDIYKNMVVENKRPKAANIKQN